MKIQIADALSKFLAVLTGNFGRPINVSTISAFARMVGDIMEAVAVNERDQP